VGGKSAGRPVVPVSPILPDLIEVRDVHYWNRTAPGRPTATPMISPGPTPVTRTDFLAALAASGLDAEPSVRRALAAAAERASSGYEIARAMVAAGALTQFQADRLLARKTDGFVIGRYVILDQAGAGPVARVYRARHTAMDRLVAVKILAAAVTRDPARRAAFQAGARAAAVLAHPNIVTVLDVNQAGSRLFVVMEYVDGVAADALVRQGGTLSPGKACDVVRQVAYGLQYAHDKGVTHGAVYPGCVLVGRSVVKVTGFGVGHLTAPAARSGTATDPTDYRAPELFHPSAKPTAASDVYSMGCLLTYLLTGRPPLPAGSSFGRARQHVGTEPPGVELARPDVPPALAAVVRAMLSKEPAYRPTAADAAAVLERLTDDTPTRIEYFPLLTPGPAGAGYLSGLHDGSTETPSDDEFPWSELGGVGSDETIALESSPTTKRRAARTASRLPTLLTIAGSVAVAAAFAVLLAVKLLK
jgi:serine/threonine protein kinase